MQGEYYGERRVHEIAERGSAMSGLSREQLTIERMAVDNQALFGHTGYIQYQI